MNERARATPWWPAVDVLRGTVWYSAANGVHAIAQWARLAFATRLGVPDGIGHYALAAAIVAPVFQLTGFQLRTVIATSDRQRLRRRALYGIRVVTGGIGIILAVGAAWIHEAWRPAFAVVLGVAFARAADGLLEVDLGWAERQRQFGRSAGLTAARAVLGLLGFVAGLWACGGAMDAAAVGGGFGVLMLWAGSAYFSRHDSGQMAGEGSLSGPTGPLGVGGSVALAVGAAPLGAAMVLSTLNASIPQLVLQRFLGGAAGGTYLLLTAPGVVGAVVLAGVGQTTAPSLGSAWAAGDRRGFRAALNRLAFAACLTGVVAVCLALFVGPNLLNVTYGPGLEGHRWAFTLAMVSATIGYLAGVTGYGMTATRAFRGQVGQMSVTCVATLLASITGVQLAGLPGAMIGAGAGLLVQAGIGALLLRATAWPEVRDTSESYERE